MTSPARGEVWLANLDPPHGHEQAGTRPCLIISVDHFNQGPAELVVMCPMTTRELGIPSHIEVQPPDGGVRVRCFIKCEDVRSVSKMRLIQRWGTIAPATLSLVEDGIRILLGL